MIPVIDLFAGPGGLNEGFSSVVDKDGNPVFQTIMSIEKEANAHQTLRLRSYVRKVLQTDGSVPKQYLDYMGNPSDKNLAQLVDYRPRLWQNAEYEAILGELVENDMSYVEEGRRRLAGLLKGTNDPWVLIGGPPCQAYSLVGRSRRAHDATLQEDKKQTLYKCYLSFINKLKPTAFVMENVKGLLSAKHKGEGVFGRIVSDMDEAGYEIHSFVTADATRPQDYVVRAERYGVPQSRHRVILFGIRNDVGGSPKLIAPRESITLRDALMGMPKIASGISVRNVGRFEQDWVEYVKSALVRIAEMEDGPELTDVIDGALNRCAELPMKSRRVTGERGPYEVWYRGRLSGNRLLPNHESRTHQPEDLDRYAFCAVFAEKYGRPAKITDFPKALYPDHKNLKHIDNPAHIKFVDRFRVQVWDRPSSTVTSHISKDGHYYIHPDAAQCRSLTVREAARLQTFPDDYLFLGSRTAQYTQVGNAVPPLLAQQMAEVVADVLGIHGARGFFSEDSGPMGVLSESESSSALF